MHNRVDRNERKSSGSVIAYTVCPADFLLTAGVREGGASAALGSLCWRLAGTGRPPARTETTVPVREGADAHPHTARQTVPVK